MCKKDYGEHVFIVGSSRSGTTLVHTILMSCPLYAVYRAETQLLIGCDVKYGDLSSKQSREEFLSDWFRSRQYRRSGLTEKEFLGIFNTEEKPSYIWLLSEYMNMVACKQKRERWIDSTPRNIFALREISKYFPNAKIIHVIRDGRAVSLSRAKLGWSSVGTKDFDRGLGYSALLWEESVKSALDAKKILCGRYLEVKYEELVENPEKEVIKLAKFLGISKLDFHHLNEQNSTAKKMKTAEMYKNNSAFGDLADGISSSAVYRWKDVLTEKQIRRLDAFVGETLEMYGYPVARNKRLNFNLVIERSWCKLLLNIKGHIKRISMLRRFVATPLELDLD